MSFFHERQKNQYFAVFLNEKSAGQQNATELPPCATIRTFLADMIPALWAEALPPAPNRFSVVNLPEALAKSIPRAVVGFFATVARPTLTAPQS
jgi:hypothetical protein